MAIKARREECRKAREVFMRKHPDLFRLQRNSRGYELLIKQAKREGCCGKTVCDIDLEISLINAARRLGLYTPI